jgi:hypothetical protein
VRSAAGLAVRQVAVCLGRPPGAVRRRSADSDVCLDALGRARTTSFGRDFPERRPM